MAFIAVLRMFDYTEGDGDAYDTLLPNGVSLSPP